MAKRMILMLAVMAFIVGALGLVKFRQFQSAASQGAFQPPPEAVTTIVAQEEQWPATVGAIGTMAAVRGVTVSADLPGTVHRVFFESGRPVKQGEVLVELDTRQERAQMAAIEAQRDLARLQFDRMKDLLTERVVSKAEYDQAVMQHRETAARVGEVDAVIQRKTIRAPFSGLLGIRQVNLGQYLAAGDPIVSLQSLNPIYVNFGLPEQEAAQVQTGRRVRIISDAVNGAELTGTVTALDSIVNPQTRNVQVQATVSNPGGALRPGMFVQTELLLGADRAVIALPTPAVSYAPYGDSVFIVTDLKAPDGTTYRGVRQQFVKLGGSRGDQVAVISGVSTGDEVVTSGLFKLRNGAAVLVNNRIQPPNRKKPKPEEG